MVIDRTEKFVVASGQSVRLIKDQRFRLRSGAFHNIYGYSLSAMFDVAYIIMTHPPQGSKLLFFLVPFRLG